MRAKDSIVTSDMATAVKVVEGVGRYQYLCESMGVGWLKACGSGDEDEKYEVLRLYAAPENFQVPLHMT